MGNTRDCGGSCRFLEPSSLEFKFERQGHREQVRSGGAVAHGLLKPMAVDLPNFPRCDLEAIFWREQDLLCDACSGGDAPGASKTKGGGGGEGACLKGLAAIWKRPRCGLEELRPNRMERTAEGRVVGNREGQREQAPRVRIGREVGEG